MFDNLCLFAHFDQDNLLSEHVLHYLKAIRATGFEIIVVSTSHLSVDDVARLRCVVHEVLIRENKGHDFASWSLGIERYASSVSGQLMIANDSVYGPIGDLNQTLARLTSVPADVYGMIESAEINVHLQSWFVIFESRVHASAAFRHVFAQQFHGMSKAEIIRNGEIGLSQTLIAEGYTTRSLFNGKFQNGSTLKIHSNYSHFLWRELIEQEGIPFLKIELLRVNPCRIATLSAWKEVVAAQQPDLVPLIEDHLARTSNSRQPHMVSPDSPTAFRSDLQYFISRDYAYASAGRQRAANSNLSYFWLYRLKYGLLRRIYYLATPIRQRIRHIP